MAASSRSRQTCRARQPSATGIALNLIGNAEDLQHPSAHQRSQPAMAILPPSEFTAPAEWTLCHFEFGKLRGPPDRQAAGASKHPPHRHRRDRSRIRCRRGGIFSQLLLMAEGSGRMGLLLTTLFGHGLNAAACSASVRTSCPGHLQHLAFLSPPPPGRRGRRERFLCCGLARGSRWLGSRGMSRREISGSPPGTGISSTLRFNSRSMSRSRLRSSGEHKATASPDAPARAVRPMRCT